MLRVMRQAEQIARARKTQAPSDAKFIKLGD
jgi:hypothetical protein